MYFLFSPFNLTLPSISKANSKPWISMDGEDEDDTGKQPPKAGGFFE